MIKITLLSGFFFFLLACGGSAVTQDEGLEMVVSLPEGLKECSGMISLGDGLYAANNDSGNPAALTIFSLDVKQKPRTVKIANANNIDWEELASDDLYVYIGDFGNNDGKRQDLAIYRILKADLLQKDEIEGDKIEFRYPEQLSFKPDAKNNYDCEAMVVLQDSLFLFTKNRGDLKTNLYSLPKVPGIYDAQLRDQFDAKGLVTGADIRTHGGISDLVVVGYKDQKHGHHPFVIYFQGVESSEFFKGKFTVFNFEGKLQTETIVFHDDKSVLITNEAKGNDTGHIYKMDIKRQ